MTTKVVLRSIDADLGDRFAEHWYAVWEVKGSNSETGLPIVHSLQGKNRKVVEAACRIKLGDVKFYELGSPEWEKEFC